jgi:hypothetical protein
MIGASCLLQSLVQTAKLELMVRPFTLRDIALVRRLSEQGVSLHAESALADNLHPLRGALLGMVVRGDSPTLIWKSENGERTGFIQLLLEPDGQHAHIQYISPDLSGGTQSENGNLDGTVENKNEDVWLSLLDQAVAEVGQFGVHSLVAEAEETGPELPVLRRAGFAVYARQDIWAHAEENNTGQENSTFRLRPRLEKDDWDIQLLYANTVPRLVQLVEPGPSTTDGGMWVQRDEKDELTAFVQIHEGNVATWMRFYIHPGAESEAQEILRSALLVGAARRTQPVYLCLRRYEGWLPSNLEQMGFRQLSSQALLVKHTVHYGKREMSKVSVGLEKSGIPVSAPYSQYHINDNLKEYKTGSPDAESAESETRRRTPLTAN